MLSSAMKEEILADSSPSDRGREECYHIAESMIEEIQLLSEDIVPPSGKGWDRGSLKRKLLRQIRQVRRMATIG